MADFCSLLKIESLKQIGRDYLFSQVETSPFESSLEIQLSPASTLDQFCFRPAPRGLKTPRPVITTRRAVFILLGLDFMKFDRQQLRNKMPNKKHHLFK